MKSFNIVAICAFAIIMVTLNVEGQCCGEPVDVIEPVGIELINIEYSQVWTGSKLVNGTLVINETLNLMDCDLIIAGEGIQIKENGSLQVINSTISPLLWEVGYYIESFGDLSITGSMINGSLDHSNQYFSIYASDGTLSIENSTMTRSGLIQSRLESIDIINSTIPGIISLEGTVLIEDSTVEGLGASMVGSGDLTIRRTSISSDISFSSSIAAISCEEGDLVVENVAINGTYGGGIFSSGSSVQASSVDISLPGGLYGARLMESAPIELTDLDITGSYGGIEMTDCPGDSMIINSRISHTFKGIDTKGTGAVYIENTTILDSENGVISSNQISIKGSMIENSEVGLLLEGQWALLDMDCRIMNFSRWGMEIESWEPIHGTNVTFIPGEDAISNISMWGRISINTYGPDMEVVEGSIIELMSSLDWNSQIGPGEVGLIWGYLGPSEVVIPIQYNVTASWGNARIVKEFMVTEGGDIDLELPLSDIYVSEIEFSDGDATVTVGTLNSEANEVTVTIHLDGTYRFSQKTNLIPGEEIVITLPVGQMGSGSHELQCSVRSIDEYTGMNGVLQGNNELTILVENDDSNDGLETRIIAITILILAIIILIAIFAFRRRS